MVIDPIQYLDLVNKLEEDAYRGIVDCDFFKIFTQSMDLTVYRKVGAKQESTGKLFWQEQKKPAGLYALPA